MMTPESDQPQASGAERRRFPRYNMALDVVFGPASATPPKLHRTVTVNLSVGGLCVYSDVLYPIGTMVFCSVSLPGRAAPVEATGTLAWFHKIEREGHAYKLGIEFSEISQDDRAALEALLEHPPTAQSARAKKLLLVDDDSELQLALKLRFESSGFEVITANEGLEALRKGREEHPNLIILDLMLPNLNGYEVCRLLKFDQKFHHIPILLVTARSRAEDRQMGLTVGADGYVTKPFNGKELIAKVEELLAATPA